MPPGLVQVLADVLAGLGFVTQREDRIHPSPGLLPFTSVEGAQTFRAALRAPLLQAEDFRQRAMSGALSLDGWTHTNEAIIEAQGALTRMWAAKAVPKL